MEITKPYRTFTHSAPLTPPMPLCGAIAAPVMPAISEWLWEEGMPKYHRHTHTMIAIIAAANANKAA